MHGMVSILYYLQCKLIMEYCNVAICIVTVATYYVYYYMLLST